MKSYTKGKNVTREELTRQSHISTHSIMMTRQQKRWLSELTESIFTKWKWQLNLSHEWERSIREDTRTRIIGHPSSPCALQYPDLVEKVAKC